MDTDLSFLFAMLAACGLAVFFGLATFYRSRPRSPRVTKVLNSVRKDKE